MENKRGMIDFTKHMNISHKKETVWHENLLEFYFASVKRKNHFQNV